jgi:hypothetical protein
MFRPLQIHHQGIVYKDKQVKKILSKIWMCSVFKCYLINFAHLIKPDICICLVQFFQCV